MPEDITKPEEKQEEVTSEVTETEDGGVAVSVKEENPQETVQEKPREEKPKVEQDPIKNKVYAHDRILTNIQRSIDELKNTMLSNAPSGKVTQEQVTELSEIDKLAQTDWKAAVKQLASVEAKEILRAERSKIEEQSRASEEKQMLASNVEVVTSRHPELNDNSTEKAQIFQSILEQNPRWRTLPDGPLLTMYRMEEELRKKGYEVEGHKAERKPVDTSTPVSRSTLSSGKVVLTREQREFCDNNGIKYEDYARTLKTSGGKEGISI